MDAKIDYEGIFQAHPSPMVVLTPDLLIVAVNRACLKAAGRTLADLLGRDVFDAFLGNPDEFGAQGVEALHASLERARGTGEQDTTAPQRHDLEAPGRPGTFEERYWRGISTPVLDPDGNVKLILHRTEDVTAFGKELRRLRMKDTAVADIQVLDTELHRRSRELQDLNERLWHTHTRHVQSTFAMRQLIEQQRRFLFDASHDLRNPVSGLLARLEVALAETDADPPQILRSLLSDAERLNNIVADLLELARLDTATTAPTELVDLARLALDELESRTHAVAVTVHCEAQVVVSASRIRLCRVLCNLLSNAERHATSLIRIVVTADPPDGVLEVIDDGPGIPPADRERVFERLLRLEDASRRDPGGTGLGLSIAREIACSYGGRLYCADHPTGARLVLRIPLAT
ncbi:MAG: ATP-binding protein [Actinomadura sp.]